NMPLPGDRQRHVARLRRLQSNGRGLALLALLKFVAEFLPLLQIADARPFDRRDVDEHVIRPVVGFDKAVALLGVEPFYGSGSHRLPFKVSRPALTVECRVNDRHFTEGGSALCRATKCVPNQKLPPHKWPALYGFTRMTPDTDIWRAA